MADATQSAPAVAATITESVTSVKGKLGEIIANKGSLILLSMIGVAAVCFLVAYILYWGINKTAINKQSFLIPGSKTPLPGASYSRLNGSSIPFSGNGKRMTVGFWIYINDIDKYSGMVRHVLHRGDQGISAETAPSVFIDDKSNKLHVVLDMNVLNGYKKVPGNVDATGAVKLPSGVILTKVNTTTGVVTPGVTGDDVRFLAAAQGITFDYIPLQRWVHVVVVANEDANGGVVYGYIDGELVKSKTSGIAITMDKADGTRVDVVPGLTNMNMDHKGDIWIGGSFNESVGPGFSGLVSKVEFFNYDLNAKDVYNLYTRGPIDNVMAKMGLPAYGLRSPIYPL